MSRNRYTKVLRNIERGQISRQEKELTVIRRKLRGQDAEYMAVPLANETKERRSTRVEQKRRHKPKRRGTLLASTRSNYPQSESRAWQALSPARPGINETRDQGRAERSTT
jgi:hypothetical protein